MEHEHKFVNPTLKKDGIEYEGTRWRICSICGKCQGIDYSGEFWLDTSFSWLMFEFKRSISQKLKLAKREKKSKAEALKYLNKINKT